MLYMLLVTLYGRRFGTGTVPDPDLESLHIRTCMDLSRNAHRSLYVWRSCSVVWRTGPGQEEYHCIHVILIRSTPLLLVRANDPPHRHSVPTLSPHCVTGLERPHHTGCESPFDNLSRSSLPPRPAHSRQPLARLKDAADPPPCGVGP